MPAATRKKANAAPLPIDAPGRRRLPILLRHAWYSLNQTFRRRLAHTGVTPDQFTTLRTLSEHGASGMTQSELTRLLASDPNTIAALVERMERNGWIIREPHEKDRRANRLRLLPAGLRQYNSVRGIAVDLQAEVLAAWSENEREQFLESLARISERCRDLARSPGAGKSRK
jgi:DNA-binding MarR family transcriptional regulator